MTTLVRPAAWRDGGPPPVGPEACRVKQRDILVYTVWRVRDRDGVVRSLFHIQLVLYVILMM
jgi:hypothetical protein